MKRSHIAGVIVLLALAGLFLVFLRPAQLGGDTYFMVAYGGSMQPAINIGDIAIIKRVDPSQIHVGDMLTFHQSRQIVTHRVVEVLPNGDFITKGDANNAPDTEPVPKSNVIGKVVFIVRYVGYVLYYAGTFWGLVFLVWIPAIALIVMEVRSILKARAKELRKQKEEQTSKEPRKDGDLGSE
jgi:signal peptidase